MRTLSLLFTAAAVALAGCDSDPIEEVFDGPTIEFGATSVNASESDGTVEIPVTLSDGVAGQTYTVEVLYAAASSTVDFDDDIAGFGAEAGDNRVATVTLSGESDTEVVTVDVLEDDDVEGPEAAVFALQNASEGARIGSDREFRLEIGTPPISAIRTRDVGTVVTVEGVVTSAAGRFTFVQDGTAAIVVFDRDFQAEVSVGDRVQFVGTLDEFNDLLQVADVTSFDVQSSGNDLPAPQAVTLGDILAAGDDIEAERVRIEGLTITDPAGAVVFPQGLQTVSDGTASATMFIQGESEIIGEPVPAGGFTYLGPVTQFGGTNQLGPLSPCEVVELRDSGEYDCDAFGDD